MKTSIDLNCDLGEGVPLQEEIIPYISSANIACGYHAGDEQTIRDTIKTCIKHQVAIGAHPSFPDRENFGRTTMKLSFAETYKIITEQLFTINTIATELGTDLQHVKPHGALYNMAASDAVLAQAIAQSVANFDKKLLLFGLPSSHLETEAKKAGLTFIAEAFADRTYQTNGMLTPRSEKNALIETEKLAIQQVLNIVKNQQVKTTSKELITLQAQTICLHGDGNHAISFAKALNQTLTKNQITIQSFRCL